MKEKILIFLFLNLSILGSSQSNQEFENFLSRSLTNFSNDSINFYFEKKLNEYRSTFDLDISKYDSSLDVIAKDQSDYCIQKNVLTHWQKENELKKTPWDRGEFYKCKNYVYSENLLKGDALTSMIVYYKEGINFYELLSTYLIENWKESHDHNESMISELNCKFSVSLSVKNFEICACLFMVENELIED